MGKKWQYHILIGLALLLVGLTSPKPVAAKDAVKAVPLSVIPVTNKYQATQARGWYDLEMKPGTKTELVMRLANISSQALPVKVRVVAASTSANAQVAYDPERTAVDNSMKYPLPTLLTIPSQYRTITIPKNTTATYHFPLTMPKQKLTGIILGSVNVQPVLKASKQAGLHSTYAYNVGVRLSNGTTTLPSLSMLSADVLNKNGSTAVTGTLRNAQAAMLRNGTLEAHVTKQGQNRQLKAVQFNQSSVAPNSRFTFKLPWAGSIAPGDYTLHVKYVSTDPAFPAKKTWVFAKNFHISALQAAQYTLQSYQIPWWAYAILVVILVLLILIIILLLRRKKKEDQTNEDA